MSSQEEVIEKINEIDIPNDVYAKIILEGSKIVDLNVGDIMKNLLNTNIIKVKDKTKLDIDLEGLSRQNSLKGIFVKNLLDKMEQEPENREKIERAIEIGLGCF